MPFRSNARCAAVSGWQASCILRSQPTASRSRAIQPPARASAHRRTAIFACVSEFSATLHHVVTHVVERDECLPHAVLHVEHVLLARLKQLPGAGLAFAC